MGAAHSGKTQLAHALKGAFLCQGTQEASWVFADETPLMHALVAHLQTPDAHALQAAALAHQHFDFTLVCGLDLSWHPQAMRPANPPTPAEQESQDAALRTLLYSARLPFAVIYGQGPARLAAAQRALSAHTKTNKAPDTNALGAWHSTCENCSDPTCERALFTGLLKKTPY